MTDNILIINKVTSTDDIASLGIFVAEKYKEADKVYIIDRSGMPKQIKYKNGEGISRLEYIDADLIRQILRKEK